MTNTSSHGPGPCPPAPEPGGVGELRDALTSSLAHDLRLALLLDSMGRFRTPPLSFADGTVTRETGEAARVGKARRRRFTHAVRALHGGLGRPITRAGLARNFERTFIEPEAQTIKVSRSSDDTPYYWPISQRMATSAQRQRASIEAA